MAEEMEELVDEGHKR